jgi:uncharacterized protein YcsI (UPF0317 family)
MLSTSEICVLFFKANLIAVPQSWAYEKDVEAARGFVI